MNDLATIQKIKNIRPHTNSDNLELADVLGWQVVVKKNEFKVGDLCVYIVTDTVLPDNPTFEFLRNKNFRIKPIRLRGQASNGICFPLSILDDSALEGVAGAWYEGTDVTDLLGVTHYEKPVPTQLAGKMEGYLPGFLIMTDELNLRTYPDALKELVGKPYYISRKDDGSSGTFFIKDGVFGVCSRRIHLKEDPNNGFWKMAIKYNVEKSLREVFPDQDIAVQGEVVGPDIQDNHLGLKEMEFHVFSLFDIKTRSYLDYQTLKLFCDKSHTPMVDVIEIGMDFQRDLNSLIELANDLKYWNGSPAEGIVIRPLVPFHSEVLNKPWSGKVINENYKE